ncbi:MAG: glycosyltransferase family 9 protein, partial [candidate division KSB1 bacterium]|nr:glycosyltransferase family 9 protein [candidate division KSB1 bacterium]
MEKVEQPPEDRDIVFCPGALGDTVLRMLAVRLLQLTGWLGGQVDCIGDRPYLKTCGFLTAGSRFFDFGEGVWWELFSAESQPSESLRAALAGVRRAIVWLPYDENAYQKLRNAGIQEIRWKAPRARDEGGPHELEYLTGMDRDELQSMLCAFPVGNPRQAPSSPSLAVIHPGAGSPRKRLPVSRYRRLASRLLQEGWKVLWLLGPAEVREASHLLPDVPGVQTQIDPPLEDVPALLGEASLVIGNDSGVMHLAAALGRP